MSMVGYILGLGDRHPSNIMLERHTGKIVHIDFGDCFEIAMRREKFPEKIPFRLTRMLIKAMEVSGIEGNFRTTCENTMRVMRESKESLLAIMEAFVYDPLISFRLLNPKMFKKRNEDIESNDKKAELDAVKIVAQPVEAHVDAAEIIAMIDENKAKEVRS
jgi:FKBP12-rapamycin complex-associated protein